MSRLIISKKNNPIDKKSMSNRNLLKIIIFSSAIVAIALTSFIVFFVSPSFSNLIVKNTEAEAIKIARYLAELIKDVDKISGKLPSKFTERAKDAIIDFGLMKIKVFAPNGEIVYSTSEKDIGLINEKNYFHNIVAKGGVYTKLVKKDSRSLEDQVVIADVVETYVPIMKAGNFAGSFEIYFDITRTMTGLDNLLFRIHSLMLVIVVGLMLALLIISFFARQGFLKQEAAEEEREKYIAELQQALNEIKTLRGIIPICSTCKKIRNDKGAWDIFEAYITEHTDAEFSHGVCPKCAKELYPNIKLYKDN